MSKILLLVLLVTICLTETPAQASEMEQTVTSSDSVEQTSPKQKIKDHNFGTFHIYGEKLTAIDRYNPEKGTYTFEIANVDEKVLYSDRHDEDYPISIVYKIKGESGEGLLIIKELFPSAPPCAPEFKVLGYKDGEIKPLTKSVIMCGYIVEDIIAPNVNTIILSFYRKQYTHGCFF